MVENNDVDRHVDEYKLELIEKLREKRDEMRGKK